MTVLAIETSCDETSVAVIEQGRVRANLTASQIELHAEYGGVVPELATREHLRNLLPVSRAALLRAGMTIGQIDAVAATRGPGLPPALRIGFEAGQAAAFALGRPFLGVHHHEAHLYSPWISGDPPAAQWEAFQPNISLIVSGGHTLLVWVKAELDHQVLGTTVDDAAGECFDKTAKLIGLPYPGGPEIDRLADGANPNAYKFPRPMLADPSDDFSFSGLKTAVRYFLEQNPALLDEPARVRDLCASVQAAIVEVLVEKTQRAARRLGVRCLTVSGGVAANRALRRDFERLCQEKGYTLRLAQGPFCTDNAAMIGVLAERKLERGIPPTPLGAGIEPGWEW